MGTAQDGGYWAIILDLQHIYQPRSRASRNMISALDDGYLGLLPEC